MCVPWMEIHYLDISNDLNDYLKVFSKCATWKHAHTNGNNPVNTSFDITRPVWYSVNMDFTHNLDEREYLQNSMSKCMSKWVNVHVWNNCTVNYGRNLDSKGDVVKFFQKV